MSFVSKIVSSAPQYFNGLHNSSARNNLLHWIKKRTGYFALNRLIGISIPFASRAGFTVQEVRAGYLRASIPLKRNKNHIGTMYAGALFTLAEIPGGVMAMFEFGNQYFPILKELKMVYLNPGKTDVTVEFQQSEKEVKRILEEVKTHGKSEFVLEGILKDNEGVEIAKSEGLYQVRKRN